MMYPKIGKCLLLEIHFILVISVLLIAKVIFLKKKGMHCFLKEFLFPLSSVLLFSLRCVENIFLFPMTPGPLAACLLGPTGDRVQTNFHRLQQFQSMKKNIYIYIF